MDDTQITYIGKADFRNSLTKFGIRAKDRAKHMYVIGKTGTGKSTFLENMIVQDIQNGNGVAFIDPHGSSADKLLDYVPEWRKNDVIYFNPSDTDFPIAFNPLENIGPERRHLVADGLMTVFEKIWPEAFSGRMTYILNNTMLALLEYPESSLLGINRMLTDKDFRKKVVASITDPAVKNAWDELMKWDDKRWSEAIAALVNKVGQLTTNPIIRNVVGQAKSTFDFRKAMDERKIIIINLSKGMIGEQNAPLIGAMLITKIYLAAMSRAELPNHVIAQMPPFYFYVDEFQNFANDSFADILSEARKYKLALTVANQYIAQMEETVRDAVFGNMGTTVAFRVGPLDAEFMERVFAPVFTQENLQNIMFGQYYVTLQIDGMGSKPFSAQGLPPIPPLQTSFKQEIINASRTQFARPRAEVEQTINDWFGYNKPKTEPKIIKSEPYEPQAKSNQIKVPQMPVPAKPKAPLPPVQGVRNNQSSPQQHRPKQESKPISTNLQDLLGKLDQAVMNDRQNQEAKPVQAKPIANEIKPAPSAAATQPAFSAEPVQAKQDLARAASPEKKSALAEALAKAMGQKNAPSNDPKPLRQELKPSEPEPAIPKPKPAPIFKEREQETVHVETIMPPAPPVPKAANDAIQSPAGYERPNPVREIPEDILRKVLE